MLISRILPIFQRYICTSYGISKTYYGRTEETQGGTGQGYILLANISRDGSCIVIKEVQNNNEDATITLPITKASINEMAVAFVDDTDFFANGEDLTQAMTKILEEYKVLFEATGGKIQFQRTFCFAWQWKWRD